MKIKSYAIAAIVAFLAVRALNKPNLPAGPALLKGPANEVLPASVSETPISMPVRPHSGKTVTELGYFLRSKEHPASFVARLLTVCFLLLIILSLLIGQLPIGVTHWFRRFGAGIFITCYWLIAYELIKILFKAASKLELPSDFGDSRRAKISQVCVYVIIILAGIKGWEISWVGTNVGLAFGCGALLCGLVFEYGPIRLLNFYRPPLRNEQHVELRDLVKLESASARHGSSGALHAQDQDRLADLRKKWGIDNN
jgi:hypothetical protein